MSAEAVRKLHAPVDIEPSDTICGECSWQLPNGRYFGKVVEYPCPTLDALADVEIRCDYCGDGLPSVKHRSHVPTTPDLQRLGFGVDKIVCPECVAKARTAKEPR